MPGDVLKRLKEIRHVTRVDCVVWFGEWWAGFGIWRKWAATAEVLKRGDDK